MTAHEDITITDAEQLRGLLRRSTTFRRCVFDDAELLDFDADEMRLEECSLRRVNFFNLACDGLSIENSDLQGARFDKADIREATLTGCEFTSATFRDARLNLSRIENCDMSLCNLDGANLFAADLTGSRFRTVDFSQTRLDGVTARDTDFSMATLRFKRFVDGRLKGVNFTEADLSGSDFSGAVLFSPSTTGLSPASFRSSLIRASIYRFSSMCRISGLGLALFVVMGVGIRAVAPAGSGVLVAAGGVRVGIVTTTGAGVGSDEAGKRRMSSVVTLPDTITIAPITAAITKPQSTTLPQPPLPALAVDVGRERPPRPLPALAA